MALQFLRVTAAATRRGNLPRLAVYVEAPSDESGDPGAFRDLLSLELRHFADGEPDWEETAAEMRQVIAGLASRDETAGNGRFQLDNRAVLDQMRDSDRDA
jgi:hypothetical protein